MKKRVFSLFLAVFMIFVMLPGFAVPVLAGSTAISARITDINGQISVINEASLSAAVAASGTVAGEVYSIEVTNGEVTTDDWNYIQANLASFSILTAFTVADAVYMVADIPEFTFHGCTSLTDANLPKVEFIGHHAFFNCGNLTGIDVTNAITIGENAFSYCSALTAVELPEATTLGDYAFSHCDSLTAIEFPEAITLGSHAFSDCDNLTAIELPKVTTIGEWAFYYCPSLTDVALPELTSAGERTFAYCVSLTGISLPKVTSIGERVFYNDSNLAYVEIPKVTSIGSNAFENCGNLTTLKVPGTPPAVSSDAFTENPETRRLVFVDANGDALTGADLDDARTAYKAAEDGNTEDNLWYGWLIPLASIALDIGDGNIEAYAGPNSLISVKQGGALCGELAPNGMITITGTTVTNKIVVDSVYANITLANISIDVSASENACAFGLSNGANVSLTLSGDNSLTSGVNRAGLEVATGQSITIDGNDTDSLTATSRNGYLGAAGIGGGGFGFVDNCGTVNITGGNITATGGDWSAGIGGGKSGLGGTINISGGIVTATGGGAGIGGGAYAEGGTVNITGGNVTAIGDSSGIGGGYNNGSEINPACDAAITIMEAAAVKASSKYKDEAISANGGILEAGSTAKILMANFSSQQEPDTITTVYRAVYDTSVTGFTPVSNYSSIAFTLPEGIYNLKTADAIQQYTNTGTTASIAFMIPDAAGINIFDEVEDAPVLASVSISGTAQVGQTLTATVSPGSATASYQWKAGNADIIGATGSTYIPSAADVGKAITVTATATGEWFGTVTSSPTSNVIAASNNNNKKHKVAAPEVIKNTEPSGLPYYMKGGKKIFVGFSATGEYIAPEGANILFGENLKSLTDIKDHWAKSSIDFVTEREIFQGIDENNFGPEISMTRAMFVTAIGRLYESSYGSITGNTAFSDVDKDAYYAGYVAWAHENDIIEGIGGKMFGPDAEVTREQMAEIMFRFAAFLGKTPEGAGMTDVTYPDKADISDWAMDAAAYCQLTGIIAGGDGGKFAPKSAATRAEVAVVIERFINEMLK